MNLTTPIPGLYIGGDWMETPDRITIRSPYDGKAIADVAWGDAGHARLAVDAAERAMASPLPAHRRAEVLDAVAEMLRRERAEVARTIALEAGKPITAALGEVDRAIQTFTFSAAAGRSLCGKSIDLGAHPNGERRLGITLLRPLGVVGAITPFNFPLNLAAHKIGPAFAAGCAVVHKPADKTPLTAFLLAKLFQKAGLPSGWLNVVLGPAEEIAGVLLDDPRVKAISFTGSAEVGWNLRRKAPKKKVLLELGNSTPVIILKDANLREAAAVCVASGYGFAGQTCISVQRVLVEEEVHDLLVREILKQMQSLRVGDPLDPETQVGPMITSASRERVLSWISEAKDKGAQVVAGGRVDSRGLLLPTLLTGVLNEMSVSCREVFGPVISVIKMSGLEEAIHLANATPYGLQAGIFTDDGNAALKAAANLEFGAVTVNLTPSFRVDQMPYGGVKESGNVREGPAYVIDEFVERRLVIMNAP